MSNTIIDTNFNFPGQKSVYKGKVREVYYINDDFEGGHIEFPYEDEGLIIKPKANSVLIFPSSFVHGVLPVVSGNRYMTQTYAYRHPLSHYDAQ